MKAFMINVTLSGALLLTACGGDPDSEQDGRTVDQLTSDDATAADMQGSETSVDTTYSDVHDGDVEQDAAAGGDLGQTDGAPADSGTEASRSNPNCTKSCAVSLQVKCERTPQDCVARCERTLVGQCGTAWIQLTACAATKTIEDYECSVLLASTLKPGVCESQIAAVTECLTRLDR